LRFAEFQRNKPTLHKTRQEYRTRTGPPCTHLLWVPNTIRHTAPRGRHQNLQTNQGGKGGERSSKDEGEDSHRRETERQRTKKKHVCENFRVKLYRMRQRKKPKRVRSPKKETHRRRENSAVGCSKCRKNITVVVEPTPFILDDISEAILFKEGKRCKKLGWEVSEKQTGKKEEILATNTALF